MFHSLILSTVLYYSNNILAKSFPDLGPYISLGVTVVNVLMTFPPIILIEVSRSLAYSDSKLTSFSSASAWAESNCW